MATPKERYPMYYPRTRLALDYSTSDGNEWPVTTPVLKELYRRKRHSHKIPQTLLLRPTYVDVWGGKKRRLPRTRHQYAPYSDEATSSDMCAPLQQQRSVYRRTRSSGFPTVHTPRYYRRTRPRTDMAYTRRPSKLCLPVACQPEPLYMARHRVPSREVWPRYVHKSNHRQLYHHPCCADNAICPMMCPSSNGPLYPPPRHLTGAQLHSSPILAKAHHARHVRRHTRSDEVAAEIQAVNSDLDALLAEYERKFTENTYDLCYSSSDRGTAVPTRPRTQTCKIPPEALAKMRPRKTDPSKFHQYSQEGIHHQQQQPEVQKTQPVRQAQSQLHEQRKQYDVVQHRKQEQHSQLQNPQVEQQVHGKQEQHLHIQNPKGDQQLHWKQEPHPQEDQQTHWKQEQHSQTQNLQGGQQSHWKQEQHSQQNIQGEQHWKQPQQEQTQMWKQTENQQDYQTLTQPKKNTEIQQDQQKVQQQTKPPDLQHYQQWKPREEEASEQCKDQDVLDGLLSDLVANGYTNNLSPIQTNKIRSMYEKLHVETILPPTPVQNEQKSKPPPTRIPSKASLQTEKSSTQELRYSHSMETGFKGKDCVDSKNLTQSMESCYTEPPSKEISREDITNITCLPDDNYKSTYTLHDVIGRRQNSDETSPRSYTLKPDNSSDVLRFPESKDSLNKPSCSLHTNKEKVITNRSPNSAGKSNVETRQQPVEQNRSQKVEPDREIESLDKKDSINNHEESQQSGPSIPEKYTSSDMELRASKSYIVSLIDRALTRELGTVPEDDVAPTQQTALPPVKHDEKVDEIHTDTSESHEVKYTSSNVNTKLCMDFSQIMKNSSRCESPEEGQKPTFVIPPGEEPVYLKQIRQLRWDHLKRIQMEMKRLEDIERFLDSCSSGHSMMQNTISNTSL